MKENIYQETIQEVLQSKLETLEKLFNSDVVFYYGEIHPYYEKVFRNFIEKLKRDKTQRRRLTMILNTPGGSAETVEKMVAIMRRHYEEVYFVVPDYAMSAGTILCMSGDKIFMDYSSSLGPIDPQVQKGDSYVPALGYLDKVNELIEKSGEELLSHAELLFLQNLDLAELRSYEQAKDLTVDLLKQWLVKYKFRNWTHHETTASLKGKKVTMEEKRQRAEEIAHILGDNKIWHSHGRMIGISTLQEVLKLKIENFEEDPDLHRNVREYNDFILYYIFQKEFPIFVHSRNNF